MNAEHVKVLEELDALLDMQGRLLFSRENYNEVEAERFGVMLLDFMRRHGVMVRAAVAALKAEKHLLGGGQVITAQFEYVVEHVAYLRCERFPEDWDGKDVVVMLAAAQESANG